MINIILARSFLCSHKSTLNGLSCPFSDFLFAQYFHIFALPTFFQIERSIGALPGRSVSDEAERSMISKLKSLLEPKNGAVDGGHWCCQKMTNERNLDI